MLHNYSRRVTAYAAHLSILELEGFMYRVIANNAGRRWCWRSNMISDDTIREVRKIMFIT